MTPQVAVRTRDGVPAAPLELVGNDLRVPLVTGEIVRYANLDNAASTSALVAVERAVSDFLPWYSSVHRGAGFASLVSTEAYAASREVVRAFIGARADDGVVFTRNTTDALNLLAQALPERTEVITFASEHHANLLPWRRGTVRHLPIPRTRAGAIAAVDAALRVTSAGPRLVAVTGASNVTGELWPVGEIVSIARRHGARVALDAAQVAPHRPIDISAWGVDYVAFSGHKLYAPFGAGVLAGRSDWLDAGRPYLAGGGAVQSVSADDVRWATGPARHEAGTPPVLGAVATAAACRALEDVGWDVIETHEAHLLERLRSGLEAIDAVRTYALWPAAGERVGVITFNLAGWDHALLATVLSAEYGIGVRHGAFCAHPLIRELTAGEPATGAVRASIGIGTCAADVDRLIAAIAHIARRGASWTYRARNGHVVPDPDPRPRPSLTGLLDRPARLSVLPRCGQG